MKNILLFLAFVLISNSIFAKTKSYYLKVLVNDKIIVHQFSDLEYVQNLVNIYYPEYRINMPNEFKRTSYFHLKTKVKEIYVERVWIKKSGKVKRERESRRYMRRLKE